MDLINVEPDDGRKYSDNMVILNMLDQDFYYDSVNPRAAY